VNLANLANVAAGRHVESGSTNVERFISLIAIALATVAATVAAAVAVASYPGSALAFWTFHAACVLFISLASRRPYRYGVLALAAFFALGFWVKLVVHLTTGARFVEPIGGFDGSAAKWDAALCLIAAALAGGSVARALDIWWWRRKGIPPPEIVRLPALFVRHRRTVWTVTVMVTAGIIVWNLFGAFAMIGVNLRTYLPLRLHIIIAFWLLFGCSAWFALLLTWERALRGTLDPSWLLIVVAEALPASITILSRSVYLFRIFPYLLLQVTRPDVIRRPSMPRAAAGAAVLTAGLMLSVGASVYTRAWVYPPAIMPPLVTTVASGGVPGKADPHADGQPKEPKRQDGRASRPGKPASASTDPRVLYDPSRLTDEERRERSLRSQRRQIPQLLVGRWVGLEGVLATTSDAGRGERLFREMLIQHPARGVDSAYQRVSRATYTKQDGFTFLTLAGVVGILASSGSPLVMGLGLLFVIAALTMLDELALRMTGSPLVAASVGVNAGNIIAQMTFPYNTAVLYGEMMAMLIVFGILVRVLPSVLPSVPPPAQPPGRP
jgi:hypothetical protein